MQPFRRILVPYDFSGSADDALAVAIDVAGRYAASLGLVHVYQPIVASIPDGLILYSPAAYADFMSELAARVEGVRARVAATIPGATAELRMGTPHAEICGLARDLGADLIVMGSHGRTGLAHALTGSVAEKVVRKAPCPVLVVRPRADAA